MAGEWHVRMVGHLADLHTEQINPADDPDCVFQHFSIPAFDAARKPILERGSSIGSNKFTVPTDAVLVSKLNPRIPRVWEPAVSTTTPAVCSTEFLVLRPKHLTNRRFLAFLCMSPLVRSEMKARVTGTSSSHQRVRPEDVLGIEVLVPEDVSEQQAIACILGALDDKIELNRRMSETLEAMARAIFKSWFVDFDPVRAKAAVRREHPTWTDEQVSRAACPKLKPEIAALFPDSFEDSELGEIPKGWRVRPMSEIASLQTRTIQPNKQPNVRWEHYSIPAYDEGQQPKYESGAAIKSGKYAVAPDSVLVSKLNPQFPRIWLPWVTDSAFAICSTEFMPFLPKHANWRPFIYEMLKSQSLQEAVKAHVTGSTGSRQRAKPSEIAELSVLVPPTDTITAFSQLVAPLHVRLMQNRRQNSTLAALRDALLPKLISGEIRVKDVERFLNRRGGSRTAPTERGL